MIGVADVNECGGNSKYLELCNSSLLHPVQHMP